MDRLQLVRDHAIGVFAANTTLAHQANLLEHAQMLGYRWLRPPQLDHQVGYGEFTRADGLQELPAFWFGHSVEWIVGCWFACHTRIIFLYWNVSSALLIRNASMHLDIH